MELLQRHLPDLAIAAALAWGSGLRAYAVIFALGLAGALGWLACTLQGEVTAGTHTFFVCGVEQVVPGADAPGLVRVRGGFAQA